MAYVSLGEKSQTIRYALLTTNVAQVLVEWCEARELTEEKKAVLERGEQLIGEIIDGAKLVEGKDFKGNTSPTDESLSTYGYAVSTLEALNLISSVKAFTEYFENLRGQIKSLIGGAGKREDAESMKRFFLVLGDAFREDVQKDRYTEPRTKRVGLGKAIAYATSIS